MLLSLLQDGQSDGSGGGRPLGERMQHLVDLQVLSLLVNLPLCQVLGSTVYSSGGR